MKRVYIKTYGCQMNERDSEAVAALLQQRGYGLANSEQEADIILLNTCSVRDLAEQKALGKMGLMTRIRRERPDVVLGFMGCMAQRLGPELLDRLPDVDLVIGTQKLHRIPDYLDRVVAGEQRHIADTDEELGSEAAIRDHLKPGSKPTAFVSIMQGCNMHCSFCIVPSTRGAERSRSIQDVLAEIHTLAESGVKEVTLLGQIVTSFGRGHIPILNGKSPFVQLLEAINNVPGIERIRFISPHPQGFRDDLVECYGRLEKLCEHVHLPVQSGSERILKAMRRTYTLDKYRDIVEKLRTRHPLISISTDFIVGFPGETEEDFEQTVTLARELKYDNTFLFKYSNRTGTPAALMQSQVPEEEIEQRHLRLLDVTEAIIAQSYTRLVGQTMQVLVEGEPRSQKTKDRLFGRTRCNRIVFFPENGQKAGQLVDVRISETKPHTLYGEAI